MDVLSSCGLYETGKNAMGLESAFRSVPEADFSEDHQMPERLLCMVVCGRHPFVAKEGKERLLLRPVQIGTQSLGGLEFERFFADVVQLPDKTFSDTGCVFPGNIAGF